MTRFVYFCFFFFKNVLLDNCHMKNDFCVFSCVPWRFLMKKNVSFSHIFNNICSNFMCFFNFFFRFNFPFFSNLFFFVILSKFRVFLSVFFLNSAAIFTTKSSLYDTKCPSTQKHRAFTRLFLSYKRPSYHMFAHLLDLRD